MTAFTPAALPAMLKSTWPRPQIGDTVVTHAAIWSTPAAPAAPAKPFVAGTPSITRSAPQPERKPLSLFSKNGKRLPLRAIPFADLNREFWSQGKLANPEALESLPPRALTLHEKMVDPSSMSYDEIDQSLNYEPLSESRRAWLELGVHASHIHGTGGGMLSLEGYAEGSIGDTLSASIDAIEIDGPEPTDPLDEFADEASSFGKGIAYETMSPTLLKQIAWEQDRAREGELVRITVHTKPEGGLTFRTSDWAARPTKLLSAEQFMAIGRGVKRTLMAVAGGPLGDNAEALLERVAAIRAEALASSVTIDVASPDPDEERDRFLAPADPEWHSAYLVAHPMIEILSEDWAVSDCARPRCTTYEEHRHIRVARAHHRRPQNVGSSDEFWNQGIFDVAAHELGTHGLVDDLVIEPWTNGVRRTLYQVLRGNLVEVTNAR